MNNMKLEEFFKDKPDWRKFMLMIFLAFVSTLVVIVLRQSSIIEIPPSPEYRRKGADAASVKILEFSDFACPACALAHNYLARLGDVYKNEVQINFKYFPLITIHPNSFLASINAECAGKQGKFWELADILFKEQSKWSSVKDPQDIFNSYAKKLNLNLQDFEKCINDKEIEKLVKLDISYGDLKKVDATPTFFVNGERAVGAGQIIDKTRKFLAK